MKSLFNEFEAYTEAGGELSEEVHNLITPLVTKWVEKGYNTRDIGEIINNSVTLVLIALRVKRTFLNEKELDNQG